MNKHAISFGFISVFLIGLGFTIISPVMPFLVAPYTTASTQATAVTLLTAIYALCTFLSAPALGRLSDRYGRKPLLLLCLVGSIVGYLMMAVPNLYVIFAGRAIDGLTGGTLVVIFAYFADITPADKRTQYFGWISAIAGIGTTLGPTIGGLLAHYGVVIPMIAGALLTAVNAIYGLIFMPESVKKTALQAPKLKAHDLNPIAHLHSIFQNPAIGRFLIIGLLIWLPAGGLQAIVSQFALDNFALTAGAIGLVLSIIGLEDIISQSLIMPRLLRIMPDTAIIRLGMLLQVGGYALLALSSIFRSLPLFVLGIICYGFGDSIIGPAYNGHLSKSVSADEQGQIQGGAQALQSLARIAGPMLAGGLYGLLGHASPMWLGVLFLMVALVNLALSQHRVKADVAS